MDVNVLPTKGQADIVIRQPVEMCWFNNGWLPQKMRDSYSALFCCCSLICIFCTLLQFFLAEGKFTTIWVQSLSKRLQFGSAIAAVIMMRHMRGMDIYFLYNYCSSQPLWNCSGWTLQCCTEFVLVSMQSCFCCSFHNNQEYVKRTAVKLVELFVTL